LGLLHRIIKHDQQVDPAIEQLAAEISAQLGMGKALLLRRLIGSKVLITFFFQKLINLHFLTKFRLLDFVHRASEQIPLLLKLGQEPQALSKAVESGDPNLIYRVLTVLKETYPSDKFYMTIRQVNKTKF